ncbi:alpha/beta fold hydrolase [Nonomuraea sp. NPDC050786]|uniref:alpha/beta hydrolase n=1 Tax=Nonomuraea sp. NPDC050786 TaxID=3154840 RepID=UPI0033FD16B7
MRITTAVLLALASISATSIPVAANATAACRTVSAKVAMTSSGPADQRVAGTLCLPCGHAATVQLLIPGGFYGRAYWRMRGDQRRPSYVETMTAAGYATLAIDRLGTGASSYPPSVRFGQDTHQIVIRQLIRQLREGRLGGGRFSKVVLVGHSLGSTIARIVAAAHPAEVDGVILTGESSVPNEATKTTDVFPPGDSYTPPSINKHIQDPVLIVNGDQDKLLAGARSSSAALHAQETPFYSPRAQLETVVVSGTGHVLNGHRTAPHWFAQAREWADRRVGGAAR